MKPPSASLIRGNARRRPHVPWLAMAIAIAAVFTAVRVAAVLVLQ